MASISVFDSAVLKAFTIVLVFLWILSIDKISNTIFMYHNLRNGGEEFIQKIDRNGNYYIDIDSKDSKNKRKKLVISNNDYIIKNINEEEQYITKKDGKYILYVNKQISEQIKEIKIAQQKSIEQEKIDEINNQNKNNDLLFIVVFIVAIFILLASIKL